jgi:hypothetical protein
VLAKCGCYGGVWRLDFMIWKERTASWPEGVGTRCNGAIYIFSAGGHGVVEIADQAAGSKHPICVEMS